MELNATLSPGAYDSYENDAGIVQACSIVAIY